ncbi:MAG TPA: hypothetical protein ENG63_06975 [Candidatus Desulfofervidus auxilii]|uniref:Right handed beta helix domain-containing protein n=1 Tax=Desulfofervidus auxilii TaxID=1621989 RepID=A0A7C0U381_DESA2|nr:hypothetical protein [Candidatus Desulfofervidus auxilii]
MRANYFPEIVTGALNKNVIIVKPGQTIQSVIDSIDASADNPYVVIVPPGIYEEPGLTMKDYISLYGCGKDCTKIHVSGWNPLFIANKVNLHDLSVIHSGSDGYAINFTAGEKEWSMYNCYIETSATSQNSGLFLINKNGIGFIYNTQMKCTGGYGFRVVSNMWLELHDINLKLTGQNQSINHIGIYVDEYSRIKMFGGRIWVPWTEDEVIDGDNDNVYGIWLPSTSGSVTHLHDVDILLRNDSGTANVYGVYCQAGTVRLFGSRVQAEAPNGDAQSFVQEGNGTIETYGTRGLGFVGEPSGILTLGGRKITLTSDYTIENWEGNVFIFDPNGANRNIYPTGLQGYKYIPVIIINTADAAENLIFDPTGLNLTIGQGQRAIVVYDGTQWLKVYLGS